MTGDPVTHFFGQTRVECFSNSAHVVPSPPDVCCSEFPEEEKGSWDPNDPLIFDHTRNGVWLRGTWEECARPEHKKALDRSNEDIVGGDDTPTSFIDHCTGDRWLVWLFREDFEANFPLACSAGSHKPKRVQIESGFGDEELSSLGKDASADTGERIAAALENELTEAKCSRWKINDTLDKVSTHTESKSPPGEGTATGVETSLQKVARHSEMMGDEKALSATSPDSKTSHSAALQKQRKQSLEEMSTG